MKMYILKLTTAEMEALSGLLDAGVRATGLRSVREATALLDKLQNVEEKDEDTQTTP